VGSADAPVRFVSFGSFLVRFAAGNTRRILNVTLCDA